YGRNGGNQQNLWWKSMVEVHKTEESSMAKVTGLHKTEESSMAKVTRH
ncbi:23308_t:CDS:2, partial [Dentiscutata erythropus]